MAGGLVRQGVCRMMFHNAMRASGQSSDAHTYWRFLATAPSFSPSYGVYGLSAYTIGMFESTDSTGTDVCIGSTVTASSMYSAVYLPQAACDGSQTTYWFSSGVSSTPQWLQVQLPSPKNVKSVYLVFGAEGAYYPSSANIQFSDDGVSWTTKKTISLTNGVYSYSLAL